jgi:hypothetical protein
LMLTQSQAHLSAARRHHCVLHKIKLTPHECASTTYQ